MGPLIVTQFGCAGDMGGRGGGMLNMRFGQTNKKEQARQKWVRPYRTSPNASGLLCIETPPVFCMGICFFFDKGSKYKAERRT